MHESEEPKQESIYLKDLVKMPLKIPPYQRPYKWTEKNVIQLLEDISEYVFNKNKDYRIGNIILHNDNGTKNIVDGQQRLTTISLLLKQLDSSFNGLLLQENFKHRISKNNIVNNFKVIYDWLDQKFKPDDKKVFQQQILNKCEFILFTVYQQDEAFQLFDSQNARGKELEPYDLLKAFHLREMELETEDDRAKCVARWESSIDEEKLKQILENHLFKIRKWNKNEREYNFTKSDIDEFKGVSLHKVQKFPYESELRMLDGLVANAQCDKFLKNLHIAQSYPFSITMAIINGKRFFEYVDYYIQQKDNLFEKNKNKEFLEFYKRYCLGEIDRDVPLILEEREIKRYSGSWRTGDKKVRNLFENILLSFTDRFGNEIDNFGRYYKSFYKFAYIVRCENRRISLDTILNRIFNNNSNIFRKIYDAVTPDSLAGYHHKNANNKDIKEFANGIEIIKEFIENGK